MKKKIVVLSVLFVVIVVLLTVTFYGTPILRKSAEIKFAELELKKIVVGGEDWNDGRIVFGSEAVGELEKKFKEVKFYKKYFYSNYYYDDTTLYCFQFTYVYNGEEIDAFVNFDLKSTTVTIDGEKFCLGRFISQEMHNKILNEFLEIVDDN